MKKKIFTLTIGLTALAFAGCESTTPNSNTAATRPNSNQAVVTNNNGNTTVVSTTNTSGTNRWSNANVNRAEYDKDRAEYEKDKGNSKIGTGANDSWIWFKTRAALLTAADLRDSTIDVDVENAAVTLRGSVASAAQKTKAEQTAKGIEGVTKVTNQLTVAANDSVTNTGGSNNNARSNANANRR
ncbi:MAG TPA: BON domain-containing protein [Pyrinomonadaceae bacterium]|jgi:osmotically-inducible protein OsmY